MIVFFNSILHHRGVQLIVRCGRVTSYICGKSFVVITGPRYTRCSAVMLPGTLARVPVRFRGAYEPIVSTATMKGYAGAFQGWSVPTWCGGGWWQRGSRMSQLDGSQNDLGSSR